MDLLFTSKESSALLDVTTVSDRGLGEANPVGQLCEELVEYVRERDLNPERFAVSVEATGGNFPLVDRNLRCFCPALRNFGCSSSMPTFKTFADSGRCRSAFRVHADHSFRGDPDQLIAIVGRVIAMPGTFSTGRSDAGHHRRQSVSPFDLRGDRVPTRRLSMRKIKEVLCLRFELGLRQRAIAGRLLRRVRAAL